MFKKSKSKVLVDEASEEDDVAWHHERARTVSWDVARGLQFKLQRSDVIVSHSLVVSYFCMCTKLTVLFKKRMRPRVSRKVRL